MAQADFFGGVLFFFFLNRTLVGRSVDYRVPPASWWDSSDNLRRTSGRRRCVRSLRRPPVPSSLFDVCISPAVMTVAAAACVSGGLITSVCHPETRSGDIRFCLSLPVFFGFVFPPPPPPRGCLPPGSSPRGARSDAGRCRNARAPSPVVRAASNICPPSLRTERDVDVRGSRRKRGVVGGWGGVRGGGGQCGNRTK